MAKKIEDTGEETVFYGTDNVFSDLGLPDADELLAKARLASAIQDIIEERGLTQIEAAELMGVDQPKVSKIIRGRLSEFSTERLMNFVTHLGLDIEIVVHKQQAAPKREGTISVAYI